MAGPAVRPTPKQASDPTIAIGGQLADCLFDLCEQCPTSAEGKGAVAHIADQGAARAILRCMACELRAQEKPRRELSSVLLRRNLVAPDVVSQQPRKKCGSCQELVFGGNPGLAICACEMREQVDLSKLSDEVL